MTSKKKSFQKKSSKYEVAPKEASKNTKSTEVPWFEGCEYKCKIPGCHRVYFHLEGFVDHLEDVHVGLVRYLRSFGDLITKTTTLTCQICRKEVVRKRHSLSKHFLLHGYTMERYRKEFNIPGIYNIQDEKNQEFSLWTSSFLIQYGCHQCPKFITTSKAILHRHFRSLHGSKPMCKILRTFKSFQCQICKRKVTKNPDAIDAHFERDCLQKMSPFSYFKYHVDGKEEVGFNEVILKDINKDAETWAIGTNFKCRLCSNAQPFESRKRLAKHLEKVHGKSLNEYADSVRISLHVLERIKCQLCGLSINHTYSDIRSHLRQGHNLEISKYYERYVKAAAKDLKTSKVSVRPSVCAAETPSKLPRISGISSSSKRTDDVDADAETVTDFPCNRANFKSSMDAVQERPSEKKTGDRANPKAPEKSPKKHSRRTKKSSKYVMASEDYECMNGCKFQCQMCSLEFRDKAKFCSHIDTAHDGMTYLRYKATIGDPFLNLKLMQCRECKLVIIHEKEEILDHLSQGHLITAKEYQKILRNQ